MTETTNGLSINQLEDEPLGPTFKGSMCNGGMSERVFLRGGEVVFINEA